MNFNKEVIIIGGGVIGLGCAHYLIEQGASVRILEKDRIGDGASHGNCGLLYFSDLIPLCSPGAVSHEILRTLKGTSPLYIKPTLDLKRLSWLLNFAFKCNDSHKTRAAKAKFELLTSSMTLFRDLLSLEELACDFEDKGILSVFKETANFEAFQETDNFLKDFGLGARKIEKDELLDMEPALRQDVAGAWLNRFDWHLRPELLMDSWKKYLLSKGLIIEENCQADDLEVSNGRIKSVNTVKGKFEADDFILATGAWAPLTAKKLNFNLPVEPGKGYSITMERPEPCPATPCMLYEKNMVVTPWKSAYRLGGTMEFSGYGTTMNRKRLEKLMTGAGAYLKEPLGRPLIEEWTSLRPMTYDDMPVIGRAPSQENLIVATGHGMLGLTLATGTGKAVCDLIYGHEPGINLKPFSLERFQ
ncbi:NAD(P)/FAD-dependent oxidoreductase [Desulfospira joergensenii]|uniref:NAD(P)/FAD-dependent oxidoreductase n=1 Tax=Desulfospira joergensenii TaxID=53329 RepID=UPI0003B481EF|nr:FAD-dependent oxidoreductase [Desulfospira joergensenii]